jgi:short-subunit dehydrogenase
MYSMIKHGVLGLSLSIREEAVHYGVKVSAVLPGMVKSELWDTAVSVKGYDLRKKMESTGMKPITPRQAAEAILKGIKNNDRTIIFPASVKFVLWAYRWFPRLTTKAVISSLGKPEK